jgi:hypothetical protein
VKLLANLRARRRGKRLRKAASKRHGDRTQAHFNEKGNLSSRLRSRITYHVSSDT